jgi:uncharacterized protein (TIGR03437 family)
MLSKCLALGFACICAASAQNVRIDWVGQACFYIRAEAGPLVVVDPPAASIGYTLPTTAADVVTISHNHGDHNNSAGVRGTFTLVDGRTASARTETAAAGMTFVQIPGFHDNANGALRGPNTIMRWTQGGLRFAHLGDYGQDAFTDAQLADLQDLDVMMIPAGGTLTIDGQQVAKIIDQLKPRVTILMHFRTAFGGPAQLAAHPAVVTPFPAIRYKPSSVLVSRATLPASSEVWVMEPAADAVVTPAAGFTAGMPVAPGGIASIFGGFTGSSTGQYQALPLPRKIGETEIFLGTAAVPLFYVSPTQVNFQVPGSQPAGQDVVEVRVGGQRVTRGVLTTIPRAPGLFLATDQEGRIARVRRGDYLTLYGSGQGVVSPGIADGVAPGAETLSTTSVLPIVRLGTRQLSPSYSGLAPGYPGLWQINVQVPADMPIGQTDATVGFDANLPANPLKITVE